MFCNQCEQTQIQFRKEHLAKYINRHYQAEPAITAE